MSKIITKLFPIINKDNNKISNDVLVSHEFNCCIKTFYLFNNFKLLTNCFRFPIIVTSVTSFLTIANKSFEFRWEKTYFYQKSLKTKEIRKSTHQFVPSFSATAKPLYFKCTISQKNPVMKNSEDTWGTPNIFSPDRLKRLD